MTPEERIQERKRDRRLLVIAFQFWIGFAVVYCLLAFIFMFYAMAGGGNP